MLKTLKPNFSTLDGIRGIAAFYVVINHCRGHLLIGGGELAKIKPVAEWTMLEKVYYTLLQATALGSEFVILFFVLSGFSIAYSLRNQQALKSFYLKRFIRLYPPYIAALIWAAFTYHMIDKYFHALNGESISVFEDFNTTIRNLFYITTGDYIGQFWSLIHEVFFYLLVPFALLKKRWYYIASVVLYLVGIFIPVDFQYLNKFTEFLLKYNIYFTVGVYLYYNYDSFKKYFLISKSYVFYGILCFLFGLEVILNYLIDINEISFFIASIASILLIVNFLEKNITNMVIRKLGEMSYTIYIIHFASMYIFYLILLKVGVTKDVDKIMVWWVWPTGVVFCLITAIPFYYLIEKNTKKILEYLRKDKQSS
ncbi:acyltransferase family protein [Pedobacter metabolipauper]|uniref:Peptidoglycan/LPS O-acetylase OafA/YrhL n=1 Tax=Pedobacter metabolipauper TaxID=425513 RepID=A0A4R6SXN8_9SPHI|nr:acyltransferase [Pedobacter metabolipauper]TDQ11284.1 peptidoglycan/LPS O-acetylase OafA/YrhL [Pedobacter metabolipauper]